MSPGVIGAVSAISAHLCGEMVRRDDEYYSRFSPIPKSARMSQFCQPLYTWIELDRHTALAFGIHQQTDEYHFFMMIRKRKWCNWEELCEIPREQLKEEYPDFIGRVEVVEALRKRQREEYENRRSMFHGLTCF